MSGITPAAPAAPVSQPNIDIPQGLKVPEQTGNIKNDIRTLSAAQQSPNVLMDFTKVMRLTSSQAYNDRQGKEMAIEGGAFDPSKVSGGTFATIIGNIEANRGQDIGKVYAATLNAYASAQEQITNRLQFLQQLKQAEDHFKAQMKLEKQKLAASAKSDSQTYKLQVAKLNQDESQFARTLALEKAKAHATINTNTVFPSLGGSAAIYQGGGFSSQSNGSVQWNPANGY